MYEKSTYRIKINLTSVNIIHVQLMKCQEAMKCLTGVIEAALSQIGWPITSVKCTCLHYTCNNDSTVKQSTHRVSVNKGDWMTEE